MVKYVKKNYAQKLRKNEEKVEELKILTRLFHIKKISSEKLP
jgi:hypothetical protein